MFHKILWALNIILLISLSSCRQQDPPPLFTARVINVYKEEIMVQNFRLLYWWEERGETPFLKPHTHISKELIVEVMIPDKLEPNRVSIATERIPLQELDALTADLTEAGKSLRIRLRSGKNILATANFPRVLKKEAKTGLADFKIYAVGKELNTTGRKELKLDLNLIKSIEIVAVSTCD